MGFDDEGVTEELEVSDADASETYHQEGTRAMRIELQSLDVDDILPKIAEDAESVLLEVILKQNEIIEFISAIGIQVVGSEKYLEKYKKWEKKSK